MHYLHKDAAFTALALALIHRVVLPLVWIHQAMSLPQVILLVLQKNWDAATSLEI